VILASHELDRGRALADREVVLTAGRVTGAVGETVVAEPVRA
jgi:hypothetical protein